MSDTQKPIRVLVVYQNVPESVDWIVIEAPTADELADLTLAHGYLVNMCEVPDDAEAAMTRISARLAEREAEPKTDWVRDWQETHAAYIGTWRDKKIEETALPDAGPFDRVFTTGFYM